MRKHMRHFAGNGCCWLLAVLLAFVLPVTDSVAEGFYVGLEAGFSKSGDLDVSQSFIDHPTRCDSFLYPSGVTPPMDAECTTDRISTIANVFAPGAGFAGGATLGYALGCGLRFEAEYLNRRQGSQRKLAILGSGGGGETFDQKQSEWDQNDPPSERVYDLRAHHFFLNVYYDLRNDSPFTPYIGAGAGLGSTEMRYSARFLRGGCPGYGTVAGGRGGHAQPYRHGAWKNQVRFSGCGRSRLCAWRQSFGRRQGPLDAPWRF